VRVTATVVLVTLLLAPAANGGAAAPAGCETFSRGTGTPPSLVRDWLAHSGDERVVMCPEPGAPGSGGTTALYFGEGGLTQHGTVCTYPRHGLTLAGTGAAAHLQRYDRSEALAMALAGPECPTPHAPTSAQGYVETYDISTSTFVGIMRLWSSIATAPAAAGGVQPAGAAGSRTPVAEPRARVQAALGSRTSEATVSRIVRIPGSALRHRYALFVKAPDASGASSQYVIYLDKSLRGPYEIRAFTETN
jgi:hypothetical protein